jgi:hypothetical protein
VVFVVWTRFIGVGVACHRSEAVQDIKKWKVSDVCRWALQLNLAVKKHKLEEEQVDGWMLPRLDHEQLLELGVKQKIKRVRFMVEVRKLL